MDYTPLSIDPKLLAEANQNIAGMLTPPPDAAVKGKSKSWTELLRITGSSIADDSENKGTQVTRVDFQVDPASSTVNAGRKTSMFCNIDHLAVDGGRRTMSRISVERLTSLFLACGFDATVEPFARPDGGLEFGPAFSGESPPVVGMTVWGRITHEPDKRDTSGNTLQQRISHFLPYHA